MRGRPVVWVMAFFLSGETPLLKPGRLLPAQVKFAEDDAGVYLNDAALVHRMVQTVMQGNHYDHDLPLGVRLTVQDRLEGVAPDWPESSTALALRELQQAWGGKLPEDSAELFSVLLAMEQGELVKLLALCVASTVDVVTPRATPHQPDEELAQAVSLDMAAWWRPTVEGYCRHVPKAAILQAVGEYAPEHVTRLAKLKKSEISSEAERLPSASQC